MQTDIPMFENTEGDQCWLARLDEMGKRQSTKRQDATQMQW